MAQDSAPAVPETTATPVTAADVANAKNLNLALSEVRTTLTEGSAAVIAALGGIASAITAALIGGSTGGTDNRLLRSKGISGRALDASVITVDDSGNMSGVGNIDPLTGSALRAATSAGNTLLIQARDVDGAVYTTFITLTSNNTPTCDLAAAVTKGGIGIAILNENTFLQQQGFPEATLTDAATISWNLQTQQSAVVTLGGNRTLDTPTNMRAGYTYMLRVIQDGTGTRTLAYHADYLFPGGVDPVLSTGADDVDILSFYSSGTKMYGTILKDFS